MCLPSILLNKRVRESNVVLYATPNRFLCTLCLNKICFNQLIKSMQDSITVAPCYFSFTFIFCSCNHQLRKHKIALYYCINIVYVVVGSIKLMLFRSAYLWYSSFFSVLIFTNSEIVRLHCTMVFVVNRIKLMLDNRQHDFLTLRAYEEYLNSYIDR